MRPATGGQAGPAPVAWVAQICATFHQSGIAAFYCTATVGAADDASAVNWHAVKLGVPGREEYQELVNAITPLQFTERDRPYNYLRYHTDAGALPDAAVPEEFSKEHLRVAI